MNFDDVLIKPRYSTIESRKDVNIYRELGGQQVLPIIASNMDSIGTIAMARALEPHGAMVALRKSYTPMKYGGGVLSFCTTGVTNCIPEADWICIDTANGHTQKFLDYIKDVREINPHSIIMAGNIGLPSMTRRVKEAGADIVKVGLGSGLACTTREMTGVGWPQLDLIERCAGIAKECSISICSDGGVRTPHRIHCDQRVSLLA